MDTVDNSAPIPRTGVVKTGLPLVLHLKRAGKEVQCYIKEMK